LLILLSTASQFAHGTSIDYADPKILSKSENAFMLVKMLTATTGSIAWRENPFYFASRSLSNRENLGYAAYLLRAFLLHRMLEFTVIAPMARWSTLRQRRRTQLFSALRTDLKREIMQQVAIIFSKQTNLAFFS
jgi:hypothetical protein